MAEQPVNPLVTVVTPTWDRDSFLLRAIMSVALQSYRPIQHVVVSDGPNPALERLLRPIVREHAYTDYELTVVSLPEHDPNARWGHHARLHGAAIAKGEFIAYLDDDDELYPDHVQRLADVLIANPGIEFSYSQILIHEVHGDWVSGAQPPQFGQISTSSIMHRKNLLKVASWRDEGQDTIDWDIAARWLQAGAGWGFYPAVTSQAHRDAPNVQSDRPRNLA
jgi:glycosyltransferase involved in cell wall biosynthesis